MKSFARTGDSVERGGGHDGDGGPLAGADEKASDAEQCVRRCKAHEAAKQIEGQHLDQERRVVRMEVPLFMRTGASSVAYF